MKNYWIIFVLALLLSACGGGGSESTPASYTVGGAVSGLNGTVVLTSNGGDDLTVNANGNFTFATHVANNTAYNVQVKTQPAGQICSAGNNTGTILGANITSVAVTCTTNTYSVGGSVSGMNGTVILTNNGGDDLTVNANGSFSFATQVADGGTYNVQVKTQPAGQTCSAGNNTGTMLGANISSVAITCSTNTYSVGGNVSGLNGTVVLTNNGGDDIAANADGSFSFATQVAYGGNYNVQVKTQPVGQTCSAGNNTGTILGANITSVAITCATNTYSVGGSVSGLNGTVVLTNNGGNDLAVSANGSFSFTTQVAYGGNYNVQVKTQPVGQTCSAGSNTGIMANANVTSVTVTCATNTYTVGGTVSGLNGTVILTNNGGNDLAVSANGGFTFTTQVTYGGNYNVQVKTQPVEQTCSVASNTGTITGSNITGVTVTCSTNTYPVGGTVSGLKGSLVLANNGGNDLLVNADGSFTFATQLVNGGTYNITVKSKPSNQNCTASNTSGTIASAAVTNVSVSCASFLVVEAGDEYTLAIKPDGTLWAWGRNANYQLGLGATDTNRTAPTQVGSDSNWASIAAGKSHSLAIKTDGTLWAWGYNGYGQLGLGNLTQRVSPVQVGTDTDWAAVTAGEYHTLAIKTNGTLWAWGNNNNGQLGLGDATYRSSPVQVGTATDWRNVSAGASHTVAGKNNGTLWAWGFNNSGRLCLGDTTDRSTPVQVGADTDWASVSSGGSFTLAIKNGGTLWSCGFNGNGQLGQGNITNSFILLQVGTDTDWANANAGLTHAMAIKTGGTLWAWGGNGNGQLGLGDTTQRTAPVQVGTDTDWAGIAGGANFTVARKTNNTLLLWGSNLYGQLAQSTSGYFLTPTQTITGTTWASAAVGSYHSVARQTNGTLWSWGNNGNGQLGLGDNINRAAPVQVGIDTDWAKTTAGYIHTLAIKTGGTLWSWGYNGQGQLGLGNNIQKTAPQQVGTATDWTAVAAGHNYSLAIKTGGTLWAWGENNYGQLGLGDTANRNAPVQVGTSTWIAVTAGTYHTLAIRSDGTLWAWGYNASGRLGLGDSVDRNAPVQVGTDTDWALVKAGAGHTVAIKTNGTLWAWGYNYLYALGLNDMADRNVPTQVGSATDWATVAVGSLNNQALKTDGTLWTWGNNGNGELGLGDTSNRGIPTQVGSATDWASIAPGATSMHRLALKSDGTMRAWGYNNMGQLGVHTAWYATPQTVAGW